MLGLFLPLTADRRFTGLIAEHMISSRVDINKQIYGIVNLVQHWLVDESSAPVKSGFYQYLKKK